MIINATCSVAHCLSTHSSCCRVDGCNITAHLVRSLISICSEIIHAGTKVPGINVVYLGATVRENADLTVKINRCVLLANLRFRRCGLPLYDQSTAALRLKVRMLKAEVMETMLYRARTGLDGLSRARPIVVQLAYRSKTLDVGN